MFIYQNILIAIAAGCAMTRAAYKPYWLRIPWRFIAALTYTIPTALFLYWKRPAVAAGYRWLLARQIVRFWLTSALHMASVDTKNMDDFGRHLMTSTGPVVRTRPGHTHGTLAENRSASVNWMLNTVRMFGYSVHDYQTNRHGSRDNGEIGRTRLAYWAKDLDKIPRMDKITHDIVMMTDVDQYVHLGDFEGKPLLLFTFQPIRPAATAKEYSYSVTQGNGVFGPESLFTVRVSGGAIYSHGVWNYNTDHVTVPGTGWWPTYVMYRVSTRTTSDPNWRIVFLSPMVRYGLIGRIILWLLDLKGQDLERANCVEDGVAAMRNIEPDGRVNIHVALADGVVTTSQTITSEAYDAGRVYALTPGVKTLHGIQQRISKPELTATADLLTQGLGVPMPTGSFSTVNYRQPVYEIHRNMMVQLMPPIMGNACFVPAVSGGNYADAIQQRVIDARSNAAVDNQLSSWLQELFDRELFDYRGTLVPYDGQEVRDRQNMPRQRQNLLAAENLLEDKPTNQPFQKVESYGDIKPSRLITPSPPGHKHTWSRFQYPVADFLKDFDWYAFGKTPKEIADVVARVCAASQYGVNDSDSSKHDGHVNELIRNMELSLLLFLYPQRYHEEIYSEWKKSFGHIAVIYDPGNERHIFHSGFSRESGNPETSNFNSFNTRIAVYFAWRIAGFDVHEAWAKPCICGGDDLHAADVSNDLLAKAYGRMGLAIKTNWIERGAMGVNFLSRFYGPHVWTGDDNSICDVPRALSKFHMTVSLPQNNAQQREERMLEKASAYALTDPNTPYVSTLSRALLARRGRACTPDTTLWWSRYAKTDQWPNRWSEWMMDYMDIWKLTWHMNGKKEAFDEVCEQLRRKKWDQLDFTPVWEFPLVINQDVLINEEIHVPLGTPAIGRPERTTTITTDARPADLSERVEEAKDAGRQALPAAAAKFAAAKAKPAAAARPAAAAAKSAANAATAAANGEKTPAPNTGQHRPPKGQPKKGAGKGGRTGGKPAAKPGARQGTPKTPPE